MDFLSRDQILGAPDLLDQVVPVPEWGGSVRVVGLTGAERDGFESEVYFAEGKPNYINVRARLCSLAIRNADGTHTFEPTDIEQLGRKSSKALERVYDVAQKLSGLTKEDIKDLEKK